MRLIIFSFDLLGYPIRVHQLLLVIDVKLFEVGQNYVPLLRFLRVDVARYVFNSVAFPCFQKLQVLVAQKVDKNVLLSDLSSAVLVTLLAQQSFVQQLDELLERHLPSCFPTYVFKVGPLEISLPHLEVDRGCEENT